MNSHDKIFKNKTYGKPTTTTAIPRSSIKRLKALNENIYFEFHVKIIKIISWQICHLKALKTL
jgi:hypothetical protein